MKVSCWRLLDTIAPRWTFETPSFCSSQNPVQRKRAFGNLALRLQGAVPWMNSVTSVPALLESRNHWLGIPAAKPTRHQISTTRMAAKRTSPWHESHTTNCEMARTTAPIFIIGKLQSAPGFQGTTEASRLPVGSRRRPLRPTAIFSASGTGSAATAFFEQVFEAKRPLRFNREAIPHGTATGSRFKGHASRRLADDDQLCPYTCILFCARRRGSRNLRRI